MPELVWVDKGKRKLEFDSKKTIVIGTDASCDVSLPGIGDDIEARHLEIFSKDDVWFCRNIGKKTVTTNSKSQIKPGQEKILGDKAVFCFGSLALGNYLVVCYVNSDICVEVKKIAECFESDQLRREADELSLAFWKNFKPLDAVRNPCEIFNYVCSFFLQKFNTYTVSLNEVTDSGFTNRAVRRSNPDDKYPLSKSVIERSIRERSAFSFDVTDVDHQDPVQSIIQNKVRKAACFPLKMGPKIIGILYIDSKDSGFSNKDFFKINAMLESGISVFCRIGFDILSSQRAAAGAATTLLREPVPEQQPESVEEETKPIVPIKPLLPPEKIDKTSKFKSWWSRR